jgi:hypothetical protein
VETQDANYYYYYYYYFILTDKNHSLTIRFVCNEELPKWPDLG